MKRIISLLLSILMLAALAGGAFAEESMMPIEGSGISLRFADGLPELEGCFFTDGAYNLSLDIICCDYYYIALPEARFQELMAKDEFSEAEEEEFYTAICYLGSSFSVGGGKGKEGILALYEADNEPLDESELEQIGSAGEYSFFYQDQYDESAAEGLSENYAAEYAAFHDTLARAFAEAECAEPEGPYAEEIGKQLSFVTADLDGNELTSEELFAAHAYTMVNIWASWCPPCIRELGELQALHEELEASDCAIIGILTDGNEDGAVEKARGLMEENGVAYTVLMPPEELLTLLPHEAVPTSYFVDQDGVIASSPVIGALPDAYRETFDKLLRGTLPEALANEADAYRVFVTDESGAPLAGVKVQLCSDATCLLEETDEAGCASFAVEPGTWAAHILLAPAGFEADDTEYPVLDTYSDVTITLHTAKA